MHFFNPENRDILDVVLLPVRQQVIVDLARAEDDLSDLVGSHELFRVSLAVDFLEALVRVEFLDRRASFLETKQLLGSHDDERLAVIAPKLPSQYMEIVSCRRAINNLPVNVPVLHIASVRDSLIILITELQKSLNSAGRVLRSLPVEAVWKQDDEAILYIPFCLTRGDACVDGDLGTVGKIAELSFPDGQTIGVCLGIAILVAEDGVFTEMRVDSKEEALV